MTSRAEEYSERTIDIDGWQVTLISYRLDGTYHAKVENNATRGWTARASSHNREEAERKAIESARSELAQTRKLPV
jgi:hypothetical protein